MQEKVYVVTKDGWNMGYGSEIYLLGVFFDEDTAKKVAKDHHAEVTEIEPNKVFPLKHDKDEPECDYNSYHLGGYAE
jgi:hypothetical protein